MKILHILWLHIALFTC